MKKILFLLFAGLLALAACNDNGDEPGKSKSPRILLDVFTGKQYIIYDNDGKLVYECPEGYGILHMAAEGKNWYGVLLSNNDSVYRVLKNGKLVFTTPYEIKSLCVENGDIYTLQWHKSPDYQYTGYYIARIFKNQTQLYEYDSESCSIGELCVDHGDLIAPAWQKGKGDKPIYWMNGKFYQLPSYEEYLWVKYIMKQGNDTLAVLQNGYTGGGTYPNYWWMNGEAHQVLNNADLSYARAMLAGGVSYIATTRRNTFVLIVNGQEHTTATLSNNQVRKMQRLGNDVYTLTRGELYFPPNGSTCIFKGAEPVEINSKVFVPNVKYQYGATYGQGGDTVNLATFSAIDFAVLNR